MCGEFLAFRYVFIETNQMIIYICTSEILKNGVKFAVFKISNVQNMFYSVCVLKIFIIFFFLYNMSIKNFIILGEGES